MTLSPLRLTCLAVVLGFTTACAHSQDASQVRESARPSAESPHGEGLSGPAFQPGDVREVPIPGTQVVLRLVWVPAGDYRIGTPEGEEGREEDEGTLTDVSLSGFWIGQTELTDDAFHIFRFQDRDSDTTAVAGAFYRVDAVSRPSPPYEDPAFGMGGEGKPAVGMTQWGALHFARWLTGKTGVFFRLPTEAEWEVACRAGKDPAEMSPMSGALLERAAWFEENSGMVLQPVGTRRPNAWQIHDMLGNASEWMLDEYMAGYHALISAGGHDPWIHPTRLHPRTVRGGSFDEAATEMRCGARLESTTEWKRRDPQIPKSFWWNTDSPFLGFRLVVPADRPSPEDEELFWILVLGE